VTDLEFHPLADFFPLMQGDAFHELVDDIRQNGLRVPIDLYESKILEGRNRYRGCREAGVEPRFEQYTGDDPLAYVISMNIKRRHLDKGQCAMIAADLEGFHHGGIGKTQICALTAIVLRKCVESARAALTTPGPSRSWEHLNCRNVFEQVASQSTTLRF